METLALVTAATWEFDPEFDDITDEAKDFICKLLKKEKRFTEHHILRHCHPITLYSLLS